MTGKWNSATKVSILKKQPKQGRFMKVVGKLLPWCSISTPPVYASFSQDSILFYPKTFSRFNDKGIWASDFLKRQKVEVCQIMTRLVEVVAHPRVKVVSHGCPVLCTPVSTRPCGAHFSDILGWSSLTSSSPMRTGDIIDQVGIVTGDPLLNWPGLVGQGAGVCTWAGWVDTTETPCLAALFEARLNTTSGPSSPVNWW